MKIAFSTKSKHTQSKSECRFAGSSLKLAMRPAALTLLGLQFVGLMLAMVASCQTAFAQGPVRANGTGTNPGIPQNGTESTAWANRQRYFDRNPWTKGSHDDDRTEDVPGTKNQKAVDAIPAFPMPVTFNVATPIDQSGQRWMMQMQSGVLPTKIQQRDIGNITRNYTTPGVFITDQSFAIHANQALSKFAENQMDPERLNWNVATAAGMGSAGASNSAANVGEQSLTTMFDRILDADGAGALINVANEASGTGGNVGALFRTIPDAVGMVMQMYKHCYVPMAILFLLPGAVISQVKGTVGRGLSNTVSVPEAQNPFEGILRSIVAIFLIPGTQVIVSWSIDVGNSLAYSMRDWVDIPMIVNWCHELSYDPKRENDDNAIRPPNPNPNYSAGGAGGGGGTGGGGGGGGLFAGIGALFGSIGAFLGGLIDSLFGGWAAPGEGVFMNMREGSVHMERQGFISIILQLAFNIMVYIAALFIVIMTALQICYICYLFLMGPLAAAFYAWPQISQRTFRGVFSSWLEAVIKVSLWRFYWMVILAVITQRLIYTGGGTGDLQWEVCIFASFLGIMLYVPMEPFIFDPKGSFGQAAQVYSTSMKTAMGDAKGGGGGGGGAGGGKGADSGAGSGKGEESGENRSETRTDTKTESQPTAPVDSNKGNQGLQLASAGSDTGSKGSKDGESVKVQPPPNSSMAQGTGQQGSQGAAQGADQGKGSSLPPGSGSTASKGVGSQVGANTAAPPGGANSSSSKGKAGAPVAVTAGNGSVNAQAGNTQLAGVPNPPSASSGQTGSNSASNSGSNNSGNGSSAPQANVQVTQVASAPSSGATSGDSGSSSSVQTGAQGSAERNLGTQIASLEGKDDDGGKTA